MWLKSGSYLFAKWDFGFQIYNTWSALRLTQVTGVFPPPVIQTVSQTGGTITFTWSAVAGKTYQPQYRTNLNLGGWSNLNGTITATGSVGTASDSIAPDPKRFYRVALLP